MSPKIKLVLLVVLPAVVLLLILEVLAEVLTHRETAVLSDPVTGLPYEYVMTIGRFRGHVATTPLNSMGFPDGDFLSVRRRPGCLHILFLGDSYTFGDTVNRHEAWVSLLREAISAALPQGCVRIFNAGERSSSIDRQLLHLRVLRPLLQPDLVILGQYQNDLTDLTQTDLSTVLPAAEDPDAPGPNGGTRISRNQWRDVISERIPLPGVESVRLMAYHVFAWYIQTGREHDILDQWSVLEDEQDQPLAVELMAAYEEIFSMFVEEMNGTELRLVILPSKMDVMAGRYPEGEYFRMLAEEHRLAYLDLLPAFLENRTPYAFQMYDGHLSVAGNMLVAREVRDWLLARMPAVRENPVTVDSPSVDVTSLIGQASRNLR